MGVDVPMIRLIFGGKQMNDEAKIKDHNITAGSAIHMVLQLKGGK
jgi:ubiquitin-like protein Nedd8